MGYFIDTSVLIPWYVQETLTGKMRLFFQRNTGTRYISRLVETEFYSALALKKRQRELSGVDCTEIMRVFQKHLRMNFFEMIHVTDEVVTRAIEILTQQKTSLKTLDALHVATCAVTHTQLITADQILAKSAKMLSMPCQLIKLSG